MEENPPRFSRKDTTQPHHHHRHHHHHHPRGKYAVDHDGGGGEMIDCSGKHCRSCTGGLIAECVAICCCPCAVVNILTLAFVKLPWKVGRKCLGSGKKKRKKLEAAARKSQKVESHVDDDHEFVVGKDGSLRKPEVQYGDEEDNNDDNKKEEEEEDGIGRFSAKFEAEKVWLELYQIGHLGFGRVSFTGIP